MTDPGAAAPAGGWTGAALGAIAGQFTKKAEEPKRILSCESCTFRESKINTLEGTISRMLAVVDDQAAQIVDLQGKLGLGNSRSDAAREEFIKKLQSIDDAQRRNIARSERYVLQLQQKLREHEIPVPAETLGYWEKPEPGDGTGLGAPASEF